MNLELKDSIWVLFLRSQKIDPASIYKKLETEFLPYYESSLFDVFNEQILLMGQVKSITYEVGNIEFTHKFEHPTPMISIGDLPVIAIPCFISYRGIIDLDLYDENQRKIVSNQYGFDELIEAEIIDKEGTINNNEYTPPDVSEEEITQVEFEGESPQAELLENIEKSNKQPLKKRRGRPPKKK